MRIADFLVPRRRDAAPAAAVSGPRIASVVAVELVSPRMRRVILQGETLSEIATVGFDDHIKLMLPDRALFSVDDTDGVQWTRRNYTIRRFDPASGLLTLDLALHGHGPAAGWARDVRVGMVVGIMGPKRTRHSAGGRDGTILIGDETALPAIGRCLDEGMLESAVTAFVEIADEGERQEIGLRACDRLTWLPRSGRAAGDAGEIVSALRQFEWPGGDVRVWIAAEAEVARVVRAYLIEEEAVPRDHIRAAGYWRLGVQDGGLRLK